MYIFQDPVSGLRVDPYGWLIGIFTALLRVCAQRNYLWNRLCFNDQQVPEDRYPAQQDSDYQLYTPNVWNEVTLNLKKDTYTEDEVLGLLERMNLNELKGRHPNSLSGGQKLRVLLAAAILKKSPVMIFDEATNGLDGKHMREIAAILRQTADSGASILLITHDREFIDLVADNIIYLEHGTVKEIRSRSGI